MSNKVKISNRCQLVRVKTTMPSQTKENKTAADEVCANHNTDKEAIRVADVLYPNACLKPFKAEVAKVKKVVDKYSKPYEDGVRVMLVGTRFAKQPEIDSAVAEARKVAAAIAADFDKHLAYAQAKRNGFFDRSQYPATAADFEAEMTVEVTFDPMADEDHIILDCAADELEVIREEWVQRQAKIAEQATAHTKEEAEVALRRLIDQLRNYEERKAKGEKTKLYDSLVGNIVDLANRIGLTNIANDESLTRLGEELLDVGLSTDAERLKESQVARSTAGDKARRILAKLESKQL